MQHPAASGTTDEAPPADARVAAAAAAIWSPAAPPAPQPPALMAGLLRALVGGAIGAAMLLAGWLVLACVSFAISGLVLLALLLSPRRGYPLIDRAFRGLGVALGALLNVLLLGLVFVVIFVPFGLLLRRGRRDRLQRRFRPGVPSYWRTHVAEEDPAAYERQA